MQNGALHAASRPCWPSGNGREKNCQTSQRKSQPKSAFKLDALLTPTFPDNQVALADRAGALTPAIKLADNAGLFAAARSLHVQKALPDRRLPLRRRLAGRLLRPIY